MNRRPPKPPRPLHCEAKGCKRTDRLQSTVIGIKPNGIPASAWLCAGCRTEQYAGRRQPVRYTQLPLFQ